MLFNPAILCLIILCFSAISCKTDLIHYYVILIVTEQIAHCSDLIWDTFFGISDNAEFNATSGIPECLKYWG